MVISNKVMFKLLCILYLVGLSNLQAEDTNFYELVHSKEYEKALDSIENIDNLEMKKRHVISHAQTPLMYTLYMFEKWNDKDALSKIAKRLIEKGADVNRINKWGVYGRKNSPLEYALSRYYEDEKHFVPLISQMVRAGGNLEVSYYFPGSDNNTLLHFSAYENNLSLMKYLLEKGINVNIENSEGETALYLSVLKTNLQAVKLLRKYKAKFSKNALSTVAYQSNKEMTDYLVNEGLDIYGDVYKKHNLLSFSLIHSRGNREYIKYIINKYKINLDTPLKKGKTSYLIQATDSESPTTLETLEVLLTYKIGMNWQNINGDAAIHFILRKLIDSKNKITVLEKDNVIEQNPRYSERGDVNEIMTMAFGKTKPVDKLKLEQKRYNFFLKKLRLLLKHGASLSLKGSDGLSSYEMAKKVNLDEISIEEVK